MNGKGYMSQKEKRFSLKDTLFPSEKVQQISAEIKAVYPSFESDRFKKEVLALFPTRELLERIYCIRDTLRKYLPQDYREAMEILLQSLPPEVDPDMSDNDFGDFIYSPYSYYGAEYGLEEKDLMFSFIFSLLSFLFLI
jgi:hypothetical protein